MMEKEQALSADVVFGDLKNGVDHDRLYESASKRGMTAKLVARMHHKDVAQSFDWRD